MNERELIALEDLCATLHKEVADLEKEPRELQQKLADLEREGRELQKELDRRDEADADIGAAFVELWNALGDRVAITFWPMRLQLTLEGLAPQQLTVVLVTASPAAPALQTH